MNRVVRLVMAAGAFLLVMHWIGGASLGESTEWLLTFGRTGAGPGILAACGWGIALATTFVLIPFSLSSRWQRERNRWRQVGVLLLVGPPTSFKEHHECYDLPVRRRLGILLVMIGVLFLLCELLELDVHSALNGKLSNSQNQSHLLVATLACASALGIIGFGLATPALWGRPVVRLWSARLLVVACVATLSAELYEWALIHHLMVAARDVRTYREGVASIWFTAAATVSFLCFGWIFAERGRPLN